MNPDVRFLFQRLHLVMDLMNSGWPSRTYPGIPPAAVENGEEQPCMGCSRGVGGVPLLRWAGRSGRGEHRRRKTQCEYRCANPPGDALHSGGIAILLLAHFIQIGRASCRESVCQYVSISVVS